MRTYKQEQFYSTKPLIDLGTLEEFKKETIAYSYDIKLEQKYKNGISHREATDKSLDWIIKQCNKEENVIVAMDFGNYGDEKDVFKVTYFKDWYFAWLSIDPIHKDYFVNKYKLFRRI